MSLDNIQLTPIVLEGLFSKSLYDLKPANEKKEASDAGTITFLGDCNKRIALVVNEPDTLYLPEEKLNFLLGILTACKLTMADIALINQAKNNTLNYQALTQQLGVDKIILFDTDPGSLGLPLQFPDYQIQHFNNQVYLSSVSLDELQGDKKEKMNLWNSLKKLFSLA